jgi:hypothetical protein
LQDNDGTARPNVECDVKEIDEVNVEGDMKEADEVSLVAYEIEI